MYHIIKYKNRKLYSVKLTRYVTLSEILGLIRAGYQICATEKQTGADVTAHVLSQVLANVVTLEKDVDSEVLLGLIKASYVTESYLSV